MIAVADTSGLLAVFNRADPEHRRAATAADACGLLVVSPLALVEVHHLAGIRADRRSADAIVGTVVARTDVVLTLDRRDFRVLRPLTGHDGFRLLPDDL